MDCQTRALGWYELSATCPHGRYIFCDRCSGVAGKTEGRLRGIGMAPRRHHHGHGHVVGGEVQGLLAIDSEGMDGGVADPNVTRCCVPTGDCLRANSLGGNPNNNDYALISLDDLRDTVRVTCNNEHCTAGRYMHRECFEAWEQSVLTYLKSCGRARSWSERQRHQNLWTKKGYDLAFKACGCKCGRGHLKKDLDWMPPPPTSSIVGRVEEIDTGKKKKRRNRNSRPTLAISAHPTYHPNSNNQMRTGDMQMIGAELRGRTGSLSSSTGSSSPPVSASSEPSISPVHSGTKKKSKFEFSDRVRWVITAQLLITCPYIIRYAKLKCYCSTILTLRCPWIVYKVSLIDVEHRA